MQMREQIRGFLITKSIDIIYDKKCPSIAVARPLWERTLFRNPNAAVIDVFDERIGGGELPC
jgi:hypothetical protein